VWIERVVLWIERVVLWIHSNLHNTIHVPCTTPFMYPAQHHSCTLHNTIHVGVSRRQSWVHVHSRGRTALHSLQPMALQATSTSGDTRSLPRRNPRRSFRT
jgi:hypothetical protein